jgi:putative peptidoglycan lipid II flippase
VVTLPLTAVLIYYSEPIVSIFLQRGAFTQEDSFLVGQVQAVFLLQLPLYALSILCVRLVSSFKASHLLLWGTIINLFLSMVLTYLFAEWFQVVGIAFAISLMYLVSTIYLLCAAMHLLRRPSVLSHTF